MANVNNAENGVIAVGYEQLRDCEKSIKNISENVKEAYDIMVKLTADDAEELSHWSGKAKEAFIEKYKESVAVLNELHEQQLKNSDAIREIIEKYEQNEEIITTDVENLDSDEIFMGG